MILLFLKIEQKDYFYILNLNHAALKDLGLSEQHKVIPEAFLNWIHFELKLDIFVSQSMSHIFAKVYWWFWHITFNPLTILFKKKILFFFFSLSRYCVFVEKLLLTTVGFLFSQNNFFVWNIQKFQEKTKHLRSSWPGFDLWPCSHEGLLILCQFIDFANELLHHLGTCARNMKVVPVEKQGCFVFLFLQWMVYYMENFF